MSKNKTRRKPVAAEATAFDQARDELFQHIIRCGVIQSEPEHQKEWFDDTIAYTAERYPELNEGELKQLRVLGERFCVPPKARAADSDTASAA